MPEPILTSTGWTTTPPGRTIRATNPRTGLQIGPEYPITLRDALFKMAENATRAAETLNHSPPERIAGFLRAFSDLLDQRRDPIARAGDEETALGYDPRLRTTEMDRTIGQLRQAADAAETRGWRLAAIEPDLNLRSMLEPLGGAVLTIGPGNFPLAYNGVSGGDFAAAIATGNPVIAKAHSAHPRTSQLLAQAAHDAAADSGLPEGSIQFFYACDPEDGLALMEHPGVSALGFTGSRKAGLSFKKVADALGKPACLEMSSINPVFILPGALSERADAIADDLAASMLGAAGQQCTSPGILFVAQGPHSDAFITRLTRALRDVPPAVLLGPSGVEHLKQSVGALQNAGAQVILGGNPIKGDACRFDHTLLRVSGAQFEARSADLQAEAFGTAALIVVAESPDDLPRLATLLEGNLTGSIYSAADGTDDATAARVATPLRLRVGRLLNDAVPTGVSVRPAMVHGGPFPATGHPGFTAVGVPMSMLRFTARRCYDRVRPDRLPLELRDANPTGSMWRLIAGRWTTGDIPAGQPCHNNPAL